MISPAAQAMDRLADLDKATSTRAVGRLLLDAIEPFGARSVFSASFPLRPGSTAKEFIAGRDLFVQISPRGWVDGYHRHGLHARNPIIFAPTRRATAFRWTDPGFDDLKGWAGFELARELGIADGIAVPCHGPDNRVGVVSFGFERFDLSPRDKLTISLAAMLAHERMKALMPAHATFKVPALTPRERDCLAFVAEGHSDAEIGERLGISQNTAHDYVENAKRKLGARTRAQAVAKLFAYGLL